MCGKLISPNAMVCPTCGEPINDGKKQKRFSFGDGYLARSLLGKRTVKSKFTALLLCATLGFLGAHKFYEGDKRLGRKYLFTLGLFGIGYFYDFFIILFTPMKVYDYKVYMRLKKKYPNEIIF